ncbi:hypothetical protein Tco_1447934 [Tanacetum coccineum]
MSTSTSHPLPLPLPIVLPHTRASMVMMRVAAPSTYILASRSETPPSGTPPLLPIPLPTPSPPLLLTSTDYRASVSEVGESSSAPTARPTGEFRRDYSFVSTLDDEIRVESEDEIYERLDDAQDDRSLMSGQLNLLCRDRRAHARTAKLMKSEARLSHEAWTEIGDLWVADRRRQIQLTKALTLLRTLQTQIATLQSQQTPTRDPTHPDVPEEAGRVPDVLAEREATRSENGEDNHDSGMGRRRQAPLALECTYLDFMKCKPLYFKGTEGVVELTKWFERMETVFRISNCTVENQINFAICTLLGSALTW